MKQKVIYMMLVLLAMVTSMQAQTSGTIGECTWKYDATTHTLTISGNGSTGDRVETEPTGYQDFESEIQNVVIEEGVTEIGTGTLIGITSDVLKIPNSVRNIGRAGIFYCTVRELILGDGLVEIQGMGVLLQNTERIVIGKNLKRIDTSGLGVMTDNPIDIYTEAEPFEYWEGPEFGISGSSLPARFHLSTELFRKWFAKYPQAGVRYMCDDEEMTSWDCGSCTVDMGPDNMLLVSKNEKNGYMDDMESYPWCTDELKQNTKTVVIGNDVRKLGDKAFTGFTNVEDVYMNCGAPFETWTSNETDFAATTQMHFVVDDLAAWKYLYPNTLAPIDCVPCGENLTWSLENGILSIDKINMLTESSMRDFDSFHPAPWHARKDEIKTVEINTNITRIGNMAFSECSNLEHVTLNDGLTAIGDEAFSDCAALKQIELPSTVTTLGEHVFKRAGLTSITLPNGIKQIPEGCFYHCPSLQTVVMDKSVTSIGKNAFLNCDAMNAFNLPVELKTVGNYAFRSCNSLRDVYCIAATPITLPDDLKHLFSNQDELKFHVVKGSKEMWQNQYPDAQFTFVEDNYTAEAPMNISSREDWQQFSVMVNSGLNDICAQLTKDVDLGAHHMVVGTVDMPFKGTFNGNGHKLNSRITTQKDMDGLFSYIEGATIKNLHLTGRFWTIIDAEAGHDYWCDWVVGHERCGTLVGSVRGKGNLIRGCRISQRIDFSGDLEAPNGGIVGHVNPDARLIFEDVLFDGQIAVVQDFSWKRDYEPFGRSANEDFWGGFVGDNHGQVTVRNSLFDSDKLVCWVDGVDDYAWRFHSHGVITCPFVCFQGQGFDNYYSYYISNACKKPQGIDASGMTSKELAKALGYGWTMDKNDNVVPLMLTPMKGSGTEDDPYLISSTEDWQKMANFTNFESENYTNAHWKQTADVTALYPVDLKADSHNYATYDGQGHTLTLDISNGADGTAPFRNVENATISNLKVDGTVEGRLHAAGLVGLCNGKEVIVKNCRISPTIICKGDTTTMVNAHGGGIIGHGQQVTNITLEGCLFDGHIKAVHRVTGAIYVGTLLGWGDPTALFTMNVKNCMDNGTYSIVTNREEPIQVGMLGAYWLNTAHDANNGQQSNDISMDQFYSTNGDVMANNHGQTYSIVSLNEDIALSNVNGREEAYDVSGLSFNDDERTVLCDGNLYAKSGNDVHVWMAESGYSMTDVNVARKNDITPMDFIVSDELDCVMFEMPASDVEISLNRTIQEWSGDGSEDDPYRIENCLQMNMLAERVNNSNDYEGKYFILTDDLTYDGTANNYTKIGNSWACSFKGHFDGQKHVISGINTTATVSGIKGVFGYMGGSVKNLRLRDCTFAGKEFTGAIAGYIMDGGSVEDCAVMGDVKVSTTNRFAGGIAGCNEGLVARCIYRGTVEGPYYTGMIFGKQTDKGSAQRNFYITETEDTKAAGLEYGGSEDISGANMAIVVDYVEEGLSEEYYLKYEDEVYMYKHMLFNWINNEELIPLYYTGHDVKTHVTLQGVTLYKDGRWNPLCMPCQYNYAHSLRTTDPSLPIYEAEVVRLFNSDFNYGTGVLTIEFIKTELVEANQPYLVRWKKADDYVNDDEHNVVNPTFYNIEINEDNPMNTYNTFVDMKCNFVPQVVGADNETVYVMGADDLLSCPTTETTIGAFAPYFELKNNLTREDVKKIVLDFGDRDPSVSTDINGVNNQQTNNGYYMPDGRKVNGRPTKKGIYFHNGKKVIVK